MYSNELSVMTWSSEPYKAVSRRPNTSDQKVALMSQLLEECLRAIRSIVALLSEKLRLSVDDSYV